MKNLKLRAVLALVLIALCPSSATAQTEEELLHPAPEDWPTVGRTLDMQRFSPLDQIDASNVSEVDLVWSRPLPYEGTPQITPIVHEGVMYLAMPTGVLALDAANGEEIWSYDVEPSDETAGSFGSVMRGGVVVYRGDVFYGRPDGVVVALEGETGEVRWSTAVTDASWIEGFTSGPFFADGKIIVGPSGADLGGASGRLLALDPRSGEILWTFHAVPGPEDEEAFATWDPAPTGEPGYGGGSMWNVGAYDAETGTLVWGVGQPVPWDRYLIRQGSAELYTASFVALDVDTGEIRWHHQVVPADEWHLDQIVAPMIADLEIDGTTRRTAVLTTTTGYLVLIDVATGEFLDAHRLAPDPTIHVGYEPDGTPILDEDARFDTPGERRLVCPFRFAIWDLGAFDEGTGLYFRPNSLHCLNLTTYPIEDEWQPGQGAYDASFPTVLDRADRIGALTAVDPVTGEIVWEFTHPYPQAAGAVATAGGIVFGAFPDRVFRAFDAATGEILWRRLVPSTTSSNPITYAVDGAQYVALPIGGDARRGMPGHPPTVPGPPAIFVFALAGPER